MGAMNDFNLWLEEKGYAEWNELTDTLDYNVDTNDSAIWDEYMAQRGTVVEKQLPLFDDDEEFIEDDTGDYDVIIDDGDDMELPLGEDFTMPLFDEHGGLTAEAYDLLYEMEQDGGFT